MASVSVWIHFNFPHLVCETILILSEVFPSSFTKSYKCVHTYTNAFANFLACRFFFFREYCTHVCIRSISVWKKSIKSSLQCFRNVCKSVSGLESVGFELKFCVGRRIWEGLIWRVRQQAWSPPFLPTYDNVVWRGLKWDENEISNIYCCWGLRVWLRSVRRAA